MDRRAGGHWFLVEERHEGLRSPIVSAFRHQAVHSAAGSLLPRLADADARIDHLGDE